MNIIFKVKSDLLSNDPECVLEIVQTINTSLESIKADTTDTREYVSLLVNLAVSILQQYSSRVLLSDVIAGTVAQAHRLSADEILDPNLMTRLNEFGSCEESVDDVFRPNGNSSVLTSDYSYPGESKDNCIDSLAVLGQWALHQHRINAGSILFSELSYTGWSFPSVVLSESDERYLFDIEVKVKMGHADSAALTWEVLCDFPVACVLQRVGLLESLLDAIGSAVTVDTATAVADGMAELTPVSAMALFSALLDKVQQAIGQLADGSLPCPLLEGSAELCGGREEGDERYRGNKTSSRSLAAQMARAMYAMRHPLFLPSTDSPHAARHDTESRRHTAVERSRGGASPLTPSVPGVAFAAVAASLPLLRARNPETSNGVLILVKRAVPFLVGLASEQAHPDGLDWTAVRFQHLLRRMDQILKETHAQWPIADSQAFQLDRDTSEVDPGGDTSTSSSAYSDLCVLRVLMEIVRGLPRDLPVVRVDHDIHMAPTHGRRSVEVGEHVLFALKELHASPYFRGLYEFAPCVSQLLETLDPVFCAGVNMERSVLTACMELRRGVRGDEGGMCTLKRFLSLATGILSYLYVQQQEGTDGNQVKARADVLESVVETCTASVVVLYGVSIALEGEASAVSCAYLKLMQQFLTLRREWAVSLVTSVALFLEISPPTSPTLEHMRSLQNDLYYSFAEMPELDSELRDIVLCTLVDPALMHVLVVNILLNVDLSQCRQDGELVLSSAADMKAFELCAVLLAVSKQDLIELAAADLGGGVDKIEVESSITDEVRNWSVLLCPLKVLTWKLFGDGTSTSDETLRLILAFTSQLEELCANSFDLRVREIYIHALVIGLLSSNSTIHCLSYFKLSHEVMRDGESTLHSGQGHHRPKDYNFNAGALPLLTWEQSSAAIDEQIGEHRSRGQRHSPTGKNSCGSSSHSSLRKLTEIAFGEGDPQVKLTALRQINAMTARDTAVLATMDEGWCVNICRRAVAYAPSVVAAHPPPHTASSVHEVISSNPSVTDHDDGDNFALQCVMFLRNAMVYMPSIRGHVTWSRRDYNEEHDTLCMVFALRAVLQFHSAPYKPRLVTHAVTSPAVDAVLYYSLCYDIISLWAFTLSDRSNWMRSVSISDEQSAVCFPQFQVDSSRKDCGSALYVPRFVWSDFVCVNLHTITDLMTAKFLADADAFCATVTVTADIDQRMVDQWAVPLPDDNGDCFEKAGLAVAHIAGDIVLTLSRARKHADVLSCLHAACGLVTSLPAMATALTTAEFHMAMHKILSHLPQTVKDYQVFHLALSSIRLILCGGPTVQREQEQVDLAWHKSRRAFMMYVISRITGPLLPLLRTMGPRARLDPTGTLIKAGRHGGGFSSSFHPDSERISKLHNCCQYELLLLLADIMRTCIDAALKSTDVLTPVCAAVGIPLALLTVNENVPSHIRSASSECLIVAVRCLDIDFGGCLRIPIDSLMSPSSSLFVPDAADLLTLSSSETDPATLLDRVLRCAAMMRVPDSFRLTGPVLGALGVVEAMIHRGLYNPFEATDGATRRCNWECEWLLRFTYDRRSVIRARSLKIIALSMPSSLTCTCGDLSAPRLESSVDEHPSKCGATLVEERLRHLLMDSCECVGVRSESAKMLTSISAMHWAAESTSPDDNRAVPSAHASLLLGYIAEILTPSVVTLSSEALLAAMECLMALMCERACSNSDSFLGMVTSLKILPKVIALLQPGVESDIIRACADRCRADGRDPFTNAGYLRNIDIVMNRCSTMQMELFARVKFLSCRVMQRTHEMGGLIFSTALRNTNIVRNVLAVLTDLKQLKFPQLQYEYTEWSPVYSRNIPSVKYFFAQVRMMSAYLDLLAVMITRDAGKERASELYTAGIEIGDLVQDKGIIATAIAYAISQHLQTTLGVFSKWNALLRDIEPCFQQAKVLSRAITSMCRIISLLSTSPKWRVGLGLGGPVIGSEASQLAAELSSTLLQLHHAYGSTKSYIMQSRVDVTLSCLLEQSSGLRAIVQSMAIATECTSGPPSAEDESVDNSRETAVTAAIARSAAGVIVTCAQAFGVPDSPSSSCGGSSPRKVANRLSQNTTLPLGSSRGSPVNSSLHHIKKKERALRAAGPSPSSIGSDTDNKWRAKVRGYSLSKQGTPSHTSTHNSTSAEQRDLTREVQRDEERLRLWCALLLLRNLATESEQMARLVNSLNVYNALIVLLNHYFSIVNTVQPRRVAPTLQSPSPPFSAGNHLEVWAPSEKDIAAAVVYAVSGLCCNGTLPKVCFLSCSAARASTHLELTGGAESSSVITPPRPAAASNSSGDLGSLCYRLLTMALFRGNKTPFRVFSVQFLESFMRGVDHGASGAASRIVLSTSIVKALRDSLNCSSASLDCLPPEVFAALLDALASALLPPICQLHQKQREIDVSPCSITDRFRSPTTNGSASLSSKSASGASSLEPVITIPELTAWICDRYLRESSTVMCALLRLLARFGDEESYAHVPAARKLHANVLSTKVILVVWRCITESSDIDVRSLAILSMWTILHASESARAVLKRARTSGELVDMDLMKVQVTGELCSRAREVLCQLWR